MLVVRFLSYMIFFGVLQQGYGAKKIASVSTLTPVNVKSRASALASLSSATPQLQEGNGLVTKAPVKPIKKKIQKLRCDFINANIPSGLIRICGKKRPPISIIKIEKGWMIGWDDDYSLSLPTSNAVPIGITSFEKLNDQSALVTFDSTIKLKVEMDDTCWYLLHDTSLIPQQKFNLEAPPSVFSPWTIFLENPSKFYKTTFDGENDIYWITSSAPMVKKSFLLPEITFYESGQGLGFKIFEKNISFERQDKALTFSNPSGWNWVNLAGQNLNLPTSMLVWYPEALKDLELFKKSLQKDSSEKNSSTRSKSLVLNLMIEQTAQAKADLLWLKSQFPLLEKDPVFDFLHLVIQVMEDDPTIQEGKGYSFSDLNRYPEARIFLNILDHQQAKRLKKSPVERVSSMPNELVSFYLKTYSPMMKNRLVVPLLEQALEHHNPPLIAILLQETFKPTAQPYLNYYNYLMAKSLLKESRAAEGIALLEEILKQAPTLEVYAKTRFELILQNLSLGKMRLEDAITDLNILSMSWQGDDFSYEMQRFLSKLYQQKGDMVPYLRLLKKIQDLYEERAKKDGIVSLIEQGFLEVFEKHQEKLRPMDILSLYEEFKNYTPDSAKGEIITKGAIEAFKKLDLLANAAALYTKSLEPKSLDEKTVGNWLEVVQLHLDNQDAKSAFATLSRLDETQFLVKEKDFLKVKGYIFQQNYDKAFDTLGPYNDQEALKLKLVCLMNQQKWSQTKDFFKDLCPSLSNLTERKMWVIRWLACLNLSKDNSLLESIRRVYEKDFEDDPQKPVFLLLTDTQDASKKDFSKKSLKDLIKNLTEFEKAPQGIKS